MAEIKRLGGHLLSDDWSGYRLASEVGEEIESTPSYSMSNTKAELLEAAAAAGVEADESMTKAEILEALNGAE